jgi:UDP-3-O-[3-hydroxymyristoyl] glucosamine N-acyltransferase
MPARLGELAVRVGCELRGDPDVVIERVATLQQAGPGSITFLANPRYRRHLPQTGASAVVLDAGSADECPTNALVAANPYAAYARIAQLLYPQAAQAAGVHASATVAAGASIDPSAWIGPGAHVAAGARIGPRAGIGPNSVVLAGASVGADTRLVAQVTLCEGVTIGDRCLLHPGAVIGADGRLGRDR